MSSGTFTVLDFSQITPIYDLKGVGVGVFWNTLFIKPYSRMYVTALVLIVVGATVKPQLAWS